MKYAVGFQLYDYGEEPFSAIVGDYKDKISEVFFAWQDFATGRSAVATRHGFTDWTAQERCEEELRKIKSHGVKLDLLFNGNCYGEYAISEKLANSVISVLAHLSETVGGVEIITTASPAITVGKDGAYAAAALFGEHQKAVTHNCNAVTVRNVQRVDQDGTLSLLFQGAFRW